MSDDARDRLHALRGRHIELQTLEMDAFSRGDWATLDAIIEEEHANLAEQRQLVAKLEAQEGTS